jgi:hypothetical protein
MNLDTVMAELGAATSTITGLRVAAWAADRIVPPGVIFGLPDDIVPNGTYARGSMEIRDLPLILLTGKAVARTAIKTIAPYLAGSGAKSITVALQDYSSYVQVQAITVKRIELDAVKLSGVEYLGAIFHLDIIGSGTI